MGWSTLSNGELLDAAEREFDLLVTTDQALGTPTKSVEAQDCDFSFGLCKLDAAGTERRNNCVMSLNPALGRVYGK
jgi:hypothetical protein